MKNFIQNAWVTKGAIFYLILVPLSWLFAGITALRRWAYRASVLKSYALPVPVIVVGNINVGGSGKTPAVIWLANQLKQQGYKPAVISRGYGGNATQATSVTPASLTSIVGDEPVLIASRCGCPVWVGADRVDAATALLKAHPECNVIISDDGLQHYRLKRDVEIAIVDNASLQTACLLPAGPLREAPWRLKTVDAIVCNGEKVIENAYQMQLVGEQFYNLTDKSLTANVADFKHKKVTAIAGIGKPERFFEHLRQLGLSFASIGFADHYAYSAQDLAHIDCDAIIMTEKDAVKCKLFAKKNYWVLPVQASIDEALMPVILSKLEKR
ncbi:MAG: tetraacyldisaccharide 4'-kinase [Methylotenera sp.]